MLSFAVVMAPLTSGTTLIARVYKNGAPHRETRIVSNGSDYQGPALALLVSANGSTDYFELYLYQSSVSSQTIYGGQVATFWGGIWVGP